MTLDIFVAVFAALGTYMAFKVVASLLSLHLLGYDLFDDSPQIHVHISAEGLLPEEPKEQPSEEDK